MQDNGYRIIKLKNGDMIITKILEVRKKTIIIERPMQFKNVVLMDQNTGNTTDMVVFKTWIEYSIEKIMEITIDGILIITTPDDKLINCYEMEKNKEDNIITDKPDVLNDITEPFLNHINKQNNPNIPQDNVNVTFNVPQEMAEEIIEMMAEAKSWEDMDQELEDEDLFPEIKPRKKSKKKKKSDASSKPPQKKDKKENKNFGNDWSDWSPDPKDYI